MRSKGGEISRKGGNAYAAREPARRCKKKNPPISGTGEKDEREEKRSKIARTRICAFQRERTCGKANIAAKPYARRGIHGLRGAVAKKKRQSTAARRGII